jgi:integrase
MLTLWKRHSQACLAAIKKNTRIPAEQRRFFRQCRCGCWVTGVHPETKEYIKKSLDTSSWEVGERRVKEMESTTPELLGDVTLKKALANWIADQERLGLASTSAEGYYRLEKRILEYAAKKGVTLLRQLDIDRTHEMVLSWEGARGTNQQRISKLRSLFHYAIGRKWITESPALAIRLPRKIAAIETVDPYEPEEVEKILTALDTWTVNRKINGGIWSTRPTTLKCLVHVFLDTGLRISDAQRIRPAIIELLPDGSGTCTLRQTKLDYKDGGDVTVFFRPETLELMKNTPWLSEKYPFMIECENEKDRNLFKEHLRREGVKVYMALQAVGKHADIEGSCRPHRFRHYFAVEKLKAGWALEDVSRLLGHADIEITHAHYAKWTKSRQQLLQEKVLNDWKSQNKVIEFKKRA